MKEPNSTLSDRVRSLRLNGQQTARPSRLRMLPWAVASVLLLTTVAFGYRAYRVDVALADLEDGKVEVHPTKKTVGTGTSSYDTTPTTSLAAVGEVVLQAKGYIVPISLVQVSPKIGGQLVWINPNFEEGKRFKEGEVLARIEDVDYQAEYDQADAAYETATKRWDELLRTLPEEIKQAEAELEEAQQLAQQLKLDLDRNKRLVRGSAVAQKDYEQAQFTYTSTQARVRRLEATLRMIRDARSNRRVLAAEFEMKQARAVRKKAGIRLSWTRIVAPISGTILTKKAELGNIVNPSAFSSGISASLCEMADLQALEVDLSIQERDVAQVKDNQPCLVMPEAYQADKEFLRRHPQGYVGYVSRLMPQADRAKGAVPVRVRIKDIPEAEAGRYLRPEMGALVSFQSMGEVKTAAK
jgi:multidrug resistance efflux pump